MRAGDLTPEDIGGVYLVPHTLGTGRRRVLFEGFTNPPEHPALSGSRDGEAPSRWLIWRCPPSTDGCLRFQEVGGGEFTGILVRSLTIITPVTVDWAVTSDGMIIEVRPAGAS